MTCVNCGEYTVLIIDVHYCQNCKHVEYVNRRDYIQCDSREMTLELDEAICNKQEGMNDTTDLSTISMFKKGRNN